MSKTLKPILSVDEIPIEMTDEEAAEFYGSHDLSGVWDELEPVNESVTLAESLRQRMVGIRLAPRYLTLVKKVAEQEHVSYRALMAEWLAEKAESEAERRGLLVPA